MTIQFLQNGIHLVQFSRGDPVLKQSLLITLLSVFLLGCSNISEESVSQVPTPPYKGTLWIPNTFEIIKESDPTRYDTITKISDNPRKILGNNISENDCNDQWINWKKMDGRWKGMEVESGRFKI